MTILYQAFTLGDFSSFIGNGIVLSLGGSLLIVGLLILLTIAFLSWKYNIHITMAFFLSFIALTFLKIYFDQPGVNDIGLFGTLYNIMLFGMAIVTVLTLLKKWVEKKYAFTNKLKKQNNSH